VVLFSCVSFEEMIAGLTGAVPCHLVGPWSGIRPWPTITLPSDAMYGFHRGIRIDDRLSCFLFAAFKL
jgi:hypothetical protein